MHGSLAFSLYTATNLWASQYRVGSSHSSAGFTGLQVHTKRRGDYWAAQTGLKSLCCVNHAPKDFTSWSALVFAFTGYDQLVYAVRSHKARRRWPVIGRALDRLGWSSLLETRHVEASCASFQNPKCHVVQVEILRKRHPLKSSLCY